MLRLSPPGPLRICQAGSFDANFGGGEANVAASLVRYGLETELVTRLPGNDLGEACLQFLRKNAIGTRFILRGGERLGIYFLEQGSNMRASQVIYDRANSAFATLKPGMIDWEIVFKEADWFHWTGITPAISSGAAAACLEAVKTAHNMGLVVSCDLNYRARLWQWGKTAREVMSELVTYCDVAIGNEEDAEKVFGIRAPESDVVTGKVGSQSFQHVCQELARTFPDLKRIAITLRGSQSANCNTWSAILWDSGNFYHGRIFTINDIVDRVGSGDSFMGGLIYGLLTYPQDRQAALDFAIAASALKHTIVGDFNLVSVAEVEKLLKGDSSGRVVR